MQLLDRVVLVTLLLLATLLTVAAAALHFVTCKADGELCREVTIGTEGAATVLWVGAVGQMGRLFYLEMVSD